MDSHQENMEKVIEIDGDGDGGWVDTHHFAGKPNFLLNGCIINRICSLYILVKMFMQASI
jgi:hypothetical protein